MSSSLNKTPPAQNSNIIKSEELFKNGSVIMILHMDELYTLRITKSNKLILTK